MRIADTREAVKIKLRKNELAQMGIELMARQILAWRFFYAEDVVSSAMIKKLKVVVNLVVGPQWLSGNSVKRYSEGHGFDPHLGQLIFLWFGFQCLAAVWDSLSRSYSFQLFLFN